MDWDLFISHASEDKDDVARPLVRLLTEKGLKVWFDEYTLTVGDSLRRSIDHGLANSRFGLVILSSHFFEKEWLQKELDGLVAREDGSEKRILPVWHNVSRKEVASFSPVLADKLGVQTSEGLPHVVREILRVFGVDGESDTNITTVMRRANEPKSKRRLTAFQKVWRPFTCEDSVIVMGRFKGDVVDFEPSGLIGFGDSMACAELRAFLTLQGVNLSVEWADLIPAQLLEKNLILLGGPDSNGVSKTFLERIQPTIQCGFGSVTVQDMVTKNSYSPAVVRGNPQSRTDYGMIFRAANPMNPHSQILYIAGALGYGTWAGVRYVTSKDFLKHKEVKSVTKGFECLVETEIVRDVPLNIRLIAIRELGS